MGLKVAIALKFMATGDSYSSLKFSFKLAHNTISVAVRQVVYAIVEEMMDDYIKAEWKQIAQHFQD